MEHLTDERIVDLIGGDEIPGAHEHLDSCSRCRALHQQWLLRMELLRDLYRETIESPELHRLRVMYRELGPQPAGAARWLARLVRTSVLQPAAVRGAVSGSIAEYEAGPYNLLLRVGPTGRGSTVSVHGQLTAARGDVGGGGTMALSALGGRAYVCDIDRFGEFHLAGVVPGRYRALWWIDGGAIELADLAIGDDETG